MELLSTERAFQIWALVTMVVEHATYAAGIDAQSLKVIPPPMVSDEFLPACFNFTYGNYNEMEFYSPGYPGKYPNGISCVMYLQAPPGFFIDLYFTDTFAIEESEGCRYDYVELRDGPFGFSDFIARFCGNEFPVTVQTKSRFLWARFTSDNVMESDGFRAVYGFKKKKENSVNSTEAEKMSVCRIYMDNLALDGEINSKVFPLADTSQRDYPINEPIDCTWEMLAENGQRIMLTEIQLHMLRDEQCSRNRIEMYDRTTSEDDRTGVYCAGPVPSYRSESNRVFLRILGSRLSEKPVLQARYTVFKPENTKHGEAPCGPDEFHCDDICLNQALVCNGRRNCPTTGADEEGCKTSTASGGDSAGLPLLAIILAGVGGLIFVVVVIGVCVTCRYRRGRREPKSARKTGSQKRNALELAVSDSNHTANHLAKQNSKSSYYSLPRPSGHATMMQHRGSFSSKVPSEGGDFGDHISESSSYKKFLQLEQNFDDDSSRCPSPYSPGFTTIIEQHPAPPGMTSDAGWNFQQPLESPFMPSLAENLSKLQQYTKFNNSFPQTIPTAMSPQTPGSPTTGMTMEFRYDPTTPVYPSTKFRIKSPDVKYGWGQELVKSPATPSRSLTFKNQDADVAPDLTREIEAT